MNQNIDDTSRKESPFQKLKIDQVQFRSKESQVPRSKNTSPINQFNSKINFQKQQEKFYAPHTLQKQQNFISNGCFRTPTTSTTPEKNRQQINPSQQTKKKKIHDFKIIDAGTGNHNKELQKRQDAVTNYTRTIDSRMNSVQCLCEFCEKIFENTQLRLNCGHFYHVECLKNCLYLQVGIKSQFYYKVFKYSQSTLSCHACQSKLNPKSVLPLFLQNNNQKWFQYILNQIAQNQLTTIQKSGNYKVVFYINITPKLSVCPNPECNFLYIICPQSGEILQCSMCKLMVCLKCKKQLYYNFKHDCLMVLIFVNQIVKQKNLEDQYNYKQCPICMVWFQINYALKKYSCPKNHYSYCVIHLQNMCQKC